MDISKWEKWNEFEVYGQSEERTVIQTEYLLHLWASLLYKSLPSFQKNIFIYTYDIYELFSFFVERIRHRTWENLTIYFDHKFSFQRKYGLKGSRDE